MWLKTEGACEGGYTLQRRLSAALAFTRFPSQFRRVWLLAPVAGSSGQLNQSEDASQQAALPKHEYSRDGSHSRTQSEGVPFLASRLRRFPASGKVANVRNAR